MHAFFQRELSRFCNATFIQIFIVCQSVVTKSFLILCLQYFHRTTGNGSCLFNASSIALIGNESLSVYLRCLTSIEMFQNCFLCLSSYFPCYFS